MKPNQIGLLICVLLAVVTGLILFVESRRPIVVDITIQEITEKINEELCDAKAQSNNKETKDEEKEKAND